MYEFFLRAKKIFLEVQQKYSIKIDLDNIGEVFCLPSQRDEEIRDSFSLSLRQHPVLTESIDRVQCSIE